MGKESKKRIAQIVAISALIVSIAIGLIAAMPEKADAAARGTKITIEEIDYDRWDREVSFDFWQHVRWKRAKVRIYTMSGKLVSKRIIERDDDGVEVKVKKLKYGARYKYKISGVRRVGARKYRTLKGTFRAIDRD